ncbi:MAG: class II aldolase/adducin family protein [Pseudomonadota bacterium]
MSQEHRKEREEICNAMVTLDDWGLNRGSSGNVSMRVGDHMLITPSGVPPHDITPETIASMPLSADGDQWSGPLAPSVEWHFHKALLKQRPEFGAIVHTHAPFSTILADARKPIPAIHYMMAAFGGTDIPVSGYARYGSAELSVHVLQAMEDRCGCLIANHGMLVGGDTLQKTLWLAAELEALAHQYWHLLAIGGGHVLSADEIAETAAGFEEYGPRSENEVSG